MKRVIPVLGLAVSLLGLRRPGVHPGAQTPRRRGPGQSPEKLDYAAIAKIRDEGLNRSQVMDHISWLTDVYGPRLTGGPGDHAGERLGDEEVQEWGLANPHRETFAFGKGWSLVRFHAHMIEPQVQPLIGFPGSWTPGTNGTVTADVVRVQIDSDADFEQLSRASSRGRSS